MVSNSKHNLIYKITGVKNLLRLKQLKMHVSVLETSSMELFHPFNIKITQLVQRLVLITETKILRVSLVNISDNFTVMTRVSVFKHPLCVHPTDAHYFKALAKRTSIVWQTFEILLVKHKACQFGQHSNTCLTNIFYL